MQCFRSFHTAELTLEGIEAAHMMRKEQVKRLDGRDSMGQAKFVESLFGIFRGLFVSRRERKHRAAAARRRTSPSSPA
jgi:hypothetical protein